MFLKRGTIAELASAHFLINTLSNWADQNISMLNSSRRVLSKWMFFSQENSPRGYSDVTW